MEPGITRQKMKRANETDRQKVTSVANREKGGARRRKKEEGRRSGTRTEEREYEQGRTAVCDFVNVGLRSRRMFERIKHVTKSIRKICWDDAMED